MVNPALGAVVFDLDDTLFDQQQWLAGAWWAVAEAAGPAVDRVAFHAALVAVAAQGSDQGRIIDRALAQIGATGVAVDPLVRAFRGHVPVRLEPAPGAVAGLASLRRRLPIGLVTDGDPGIQQAKLAALGFTEGFDVVVFSDHRGRDHRKPHPAPFLDAARGLGVPADSCLFVGDRPDKDVAGSRAAGYHGCIRVRTGEYAAAPDPPGCHSVPSLSDAFAAVDRLLPAGRS